MATAELILKQGRIATGDPHRPRVDAVAIQDGRFRAVGTEAEVMAWKGADTRVIDLGGRTVIPGLIDSHIHTIRGGLNYNLELRWDGVPSLADALRRLRAQAQRTPPPQWVRVVGGWNEFQFAEKRLPTLEELNAAAPETPVFVLYLYGLALLNGAALRAVGYTKDTPNPPGGEIQRDKQGHPTGLLIARPNASILYSTLAKGPRLSYEDQVNSTRHFMRELNRLGLTSVIDAGGGFQNYPDDYRVIEELHAQGLLTVRIAYNLFTQKPQGELEDFRRWTATTTPGQGDAFYRLNGAGEMLVFSAADFEDFLEPRPDLPATLEDELEAVVRHLAEHRWPFRLHATYDESITRFLDVFERVNRDVPFQGLKWWFDHAETISPRNLERTRALGGGIAIQNRMSFQGEHFLARYGAEAAAHAPPIRGMLELGIPVGAGTDATRVSSYNPWVSLYWLVTGTTVGGQALRPPTQRMSREEALRLYTEGSAWFSGEEKDKGRIAEGRLADLAVLSGDYFSVPEEEIKHLESVLTLVDGKVVHGSGGFAPLAPPLPPVSPGWSPVTLGGRGASAAGPAPSGHAHVHAHPHPHPHPHGSLLTGPWDRGCDCFVF
ncbi:amidohydrolase [Archangium primigenium]|uniref:amidohydrolase n=1 Tax=[Archangium] primigenium TaxID=2792470 RepID=UPI00195E2112|nr:amidohydrolase [Archangium primigenium]MBM7117001.1 amidohydrolase [Archangium primigenium]